MPIKIEGVTYVTIKEATKILGRGKTTTTRWAKKLPFGLGRLHGVMREKNTGQLLIPLSELKRCPIKGDPKNYEPIEIFEAIERSEVR